MNLKQRQLRVLFTHSSAEFSTFDVARGYRRALERTGRYDIRDYRLYARMKYHATALGQKAENINLLSRIASENLIVEAMKHRADVVFIVSGMALHPDAIWLLAKAGIRTVVLFTESPYNDAEQRAFHAVYPDMTCWTMERTSAVDGWRYLAHAYDPEIHQPAAPTQPPSDVLFIGTLWRERIALLDAVDWAGLRVRLIGTWVAPPLPVETRIGASYEDGCLHNVAVPGYAASAAICLNPYRAHPVAESLNPRAFELAACGAFQLADWRAEAVEVFNGQAPALMFTASTLEEQIRYWLARPDDRRAQAEAMREAVQPHTFHARVETLTADW